MRLCSTKISLWPALIKIESQGAITSVIKQFDIKPEEGRALTNTRYGNLQSIGIPALGVDLNLEEGRAIDGEWYARPSLGHYVGLNKDDHGVTVDYLIYASVGWRTMPQPGHMEPGMDAKLFHDGFAESLFRVTERKVLSSESELIPSKSESRQLVLVLDDPARDTYYAFTLEAKD